MKSALAGTVERARSTLSTISLGQKVVIGLLLVGLLLGGFFFFRWITAPTQAPLFSNLASADASAIVDELNAAGVAYELTDGGQTIMVAKDAVYYAEPTNIQRASVAGRKPAASFISICSMSDIAHRRSISGLSVSISGKSKVVV